MQITDHKRLFMIRYGLIPEPEKKTAGVSRRVLRRSFEALWTVAKGDREQKLLTALYARLGVELEEIGEWEEEAEAQEPAEKITAA